MDREQYLTLKETAEFFRVQPLTVRRWVLAGKIPAIKVQGQWRFSPREINNWARKGSNQPEEWRILIVDDDDQIRPAWRRVLEREGYIVREAQNGREALDRINDNPPDIMLLDLDMPVMNGPETLNIVRQRYPDLAVIVITAFGNSNLMEEAMPHAPFTVLNKPCLPNAVLKAVKQTLPSVKRQSGSPINPIQ